MLKCALLLLVWALKPAYAKHYTALQDCQVTWLCASTSAHASWLLVQSQTLRLSLAYPPVWNCFNVNTTDMCLSALRALAPG